MQRLQDLHGIQYAPHAEVVRDAAVHDMDVGPVDAVLELRLFLYVAGRARGGPGGSAASTNGLIQGGSS